MDMQVKALEIYHLKISKQAKTKLLNDLVLDCRNEMEAQDQNMHPEVQHNLAEGYRTARILLRKLGNHLH